MEKHYHIKHINDYTLIEFDKTKNNIIERIKKYGYRNCKKNINRYWINKCLNDLNIGYAYFHTENIETKNNDGKNIITSKNRPCAYICLEKISSDVLYISLVCSLTTQSHLGTLLINKAFEYAKNNNFIKITLDSVSDKTTEYYLKKGFVIEKKILKSINDNTTHMVNKLQK